jgi:signal transduction histidine kinase
MRAGSARWERWSLRSCTNSHSPFRSLLHAKASFRWLQHDPPNVTEARKGTGKIIEAGALASEIIDRLRSLYNNAPFKWDLVATNEVIGELARMMGGEAREHGVSIRTDLKEDLPTTVADRVQLQQVLMNLILNGIEATKDTGDVLTVKSQFFGSKDRSATPR